MWKNQRKTAYLFILTKESSSIKLHFLCSVSALKSGNTLNIFIIFFFKLFLIQFFVPICHSFILFCLISIWCIFVVFSVNDAECILLKLNLDEFLQKLFKVSYRGTPAKKFAKFKPKYISWRFKPKRISWSPWLEKSWRVSILRTT